MHPIAFNLGPLPVHWYGIMVALGYLASVFVMLWRRKMAGLEAEQVFDLSMITIVAGLLGARIFYVVQFWTRDGFSENILRVFRIDQGGLVFYGGFICAMLGIWLYCRKKKFSTLSVMDMMAPGLALGHAFGRIGCFLQGCCYGKPTELPWAVSFPQGSVSLTRYPDLAQGGHCSLSLHPTQLYECFANVLIFLLLVALGKRLKPGQVAAVYMAAYGVMRFTVEFFRGDHTDFFVDGLFTPSQTISLFVIIPAAAIFFFVLGRRKHVAA